MTALGQLDFELGATSLKKAGEGDAVLGAEQYPVSRGPRGWQWWPPWLHQTDSVAYFSAWTSSFYPLGEYMFAASQQLCEQHQYHLSKFLLSLKQLDSAFTPGSFI